MAKDLVNCFLFPFLVLICFSDDTLDGVFAIFPATTGVKCIVLMLPFLLEGGGTFWHMLIPGMPVGV